MQTTTLKVNGMSCSHCENAVITALKELDGVQDVKVSLQDKTVTIEHTAATSADDMKQKIEDEGYDIL
jgi:copper chaperone